MTFNPQRLLDAAVAHHRAGNLAAAEPLYRQILARIPDHADGLHLLGVIASQTGQHQAATALIGRAIAINPGVADYHGNLGEALRAMGRPQEALAALDEAIRQAPGALGPHMTRGRVLIELGRPAEAETALRTVVTKDPAALPARLHLAQALAAQGRRAEAADCLRVALGIDPRYHSARIELAIQLMALDQPQAAHDEAAAAARLDPGAAVPCELMGDALFRLGRLEEAIDAFKQATRREPGRAVGYYNLGVVLQLMGRAAEAEAAYRTSIQLDPRDVRTHYALGVIFASTGRGPAAVAAYCEAIKVDPGHGGSYVGLGIALQEQRRFDEGREAFERALAIEPANTLALASLVSLKHYACDWTGLELLETRLLERMRDERQTFAPFTLLAMESSRNDQLIAGRRAAADILSRTTPLPPARRRRKPGDRLRIGYLSADFHQHATAYLTAEVFESHDRDRFEIVGYSYGPDDGTAMRARMVRAFDRFVDLAACDHLTAARRIRADGIDILVDLKGYTSDNRLGILAWRPAPVQVAWLGYPGTCGASFIDYIIADDFVLPPDHEADYTEQVLRVPLCYQSNDSRREIAVDVPARQACGLPAQGFIFCCFNNSFKIRPKIFDVWMDLLAAVPGSVLWLLDANTAMTANLRRAAAARGVDSNRLIFAPRLPLPMHLARHGCADLFLDTLPYNAHTTASDALWAGLPVLTCAGDTFASRVAGSLLRALGLSDLVTTSPEAYRTQALRLAGDPELLRRFRLKIESVRQTHAVFNGAVFAQELEKLYCQISTESV